MVTHQKTSPNAEATISVEQVSSLSAIGSMSLPSSVTWLYFLAIHPSSLSVEAAMMNRIAAVHRRPWLCEPHGPAAISMPRKTSTNTIRV